MKWNWTSVLPQPKSLKKDKRKKREKMHGIFLDLQLLGLWPVTVDFFSYCFFFPFLELFDCYPLDFPKCTSKSFLQIIFISFLASSSKVLFEVFSFLTVFETLASPFANRTVVLAWQVINFSNFLYMLIPYAFSISIGLPYIWETHSENILLVVLTTPIEMEEVDKMRTSLKTSKDLWLAKQD